MTEAVDRPVWFDQQVLECMPALRGYAMSLSRNHARAEDLTQDAILMALRKFEQFEPGTNIKAWLFTILRNRFFDGARRSGREVSDPDGIMAGNVSVNEGQSWAYDLKVVRKRMRMLNSLQRRSLEMIGVEQQSYEYASEVLDIPVGTVKSQVSRARVFLDTGDEVDLAYDPAPPSVTGSIGDEIERLYGRGHSVAAIKAELGSVARSDIMRVIVERKLKAPPR